MAEPEGPTGPEEPATSVTSVEDEHKAMLARQKVLTEAVNSLPEFMEEIRSVLKTLPTQKDIDVMMNTKFGEYDKGLKDNLNGVFDKFDQRFKAVELRTAGGGGGFMDLISKALSGQTPINIPGLMGGSSTPTYESEIQKLEQDFVGRMRLEYRSWLSEKIGSLTRMTETAPPAALRHP